MTVNMRLAIAGIVFIGILIFVFNADKPTTPSSPPSPVPAPQLVASSSEKQVEVSSNPTSASPVAPEPMSVPATASPSPSTDDQIKNSVEYKLAVVEKGDYVDPDDPVVAQLGSALDKFQTKCDSPRDRLANVMVLMHDRMKDRGVDESYLSILTHVYDSIPDGTYYHGSEISEPFAAYAVLRAPSN